MHRAFISAKNGTELRFFSEDPLGFTTELSGFMWHMYFVNVRHRALKCATQSFNSSSGNSCLNIDPDKSAYCYL